MGGIPAAKGAVYQGRAAAREEDSPFNDQVHQLVKDPPGAQRGRSSLRLLDAGAVTPLVTANEKYFRISVKRIEADRQFSVGE